MVALLSWGSAGPLAAQDEAVVEAVAGLLAAADARRFDAPLLAAAARHPDPVVRRQAALAMGRIRDAGAVATLIEMLSDEDSVVQQDAAFALGLIRDPTALGALRAAAFSAGSPGGAAAEASTAIAKTAGPEAAALITEIVTQAMPALRSGSVRGAAVRALGEAWRLGSDAPVAVLISAAEGANGAPRWGSVYSLARLRAPGAGRVLLDAAADTSAGVRAIAARALSAAYADTASLSRGEVAVVVSRLLRDPDPGVRVNALRALASFHDPRLGDAALDLTSDPDASVRVEATAAVGRLAPPGVGAVLIRLADDRVFAVRRQALLSLARVDRAAALKRAAAWITSTEWRLRVAGPEALELIGGDTALGWLELMLEDPDGRVAASAFEALSRADTAAAREIGPSLLTHRDPVVRALAAMQVRTTPRPVDLDAVITAYEVALGDAVPDARIAAVEALGAIARLGPSQEFAVEDAFLRRFPTCDDYLVRRAAAEHLPAAARRWGPPFPTATGREMGDYREIARRLVLPAERTAEEPSVVIETDRGSVVVRLFAAEAPLTVNALLQLVERRYFDNGSWHRVVPNFVIQDGDPRGDGWGGPGFALRDELNRRKYERGVVGMALSGPDTGGSQFFITHAPQPHLDGAFTVIGQVEVGMDVVDRVTQGDRIQTIRRR